MTKEKFKVKRDKKIIKSTFPPRDSLGKNLIVHLQVVNN